MTPGYHIYFDTLTPIFKARVNMASASYPATELVFDGVTLGAFGDIIPDMTLTLGTTEGGDDLGRVRVQNVADLDSIPIGRVSQGVEDGTLNIEDNAYITVYDDYRVWSKIPFMSLDGEADTFKDGDIAVLSYNDEIPPKANPGPYFADYIDDDTGVITVQFPLNGVDISYALAAGATITDYLWDVVDGTITVGTAADPVITATFPPGKRWVGLTVTDSNGKVQTSRVFVLAVDPDDDVTYKHWGDASFAIKREGQEITVQLNAPLPLADHADGFLCLVWKDGPTSPGDRSHMLFSGWHEVDSWNISSRKTGFSRNTTIRCLDVAGRLGKLPGFPQALERSDEVSWEYMPDLTMNRALNYLGAWHTTAWSLCDVILPVDGDEYDMMRIDTGASNIFDQLYNTAKKMVPAHLLCCNPLGQLTFLEDWMEVDIGDRPATGHILLTADIADISAEKNRHPKMHSLHTGAIVTSTDWIIIGGEKDLEIVFSKAPGDTFSQGTQEGIESQGITQSQEDLNVATGHRYARHNARYSHFDISLANVANWWEFSPGYLFRVQLNLPEFYQAQRGLEFETAQGMLHTMTVNLRNRKTGVATDLRLTWELETFGYPAVTFIPETEEDPDDSEVPTPTPTTPPGFGAELERLAGIGLDGYVYRTEDFQDATPTWDRVSMGLGGTPYTWVVDPFSPGFLDAAGGPVNGWIVDDTDIYRIEDIFGTVTTESIYTFDTPTVSGDFHWRSIQASFGAFFSAGVNPWLMVVSYYADTTGKEGTHAVYSTDGGVTFSEEIQISDLYATEPYTRFNPIGVYLSPKTPGLAYTIAHISGTETAPFRTLNYGAAWEEIATPLIQPGQRHAGTLHFPWLDNDDEQLVYHGSQINEEMEGTPEELMPVMALWIDGGSLNVAGPMHQLGDLREAEEIGTVVGPGPGGSTVDGSYIIIAPPPNTKRVYATVSWNSVDEREGLSASVAMSLQTHASGGIARTESNNFDHAENVTMSGSWGIQWYKANPTGDWLVNNVSIYSSPPALPQSSASHLDLDVVVNSGGSSNRALGRITCTVTVTSIELHDGTIYTPTPSTSGRTFRLKRVQGGLVADISPTDGSILYGVNRGHFGVRTFDGNKQYLLASVIGNDDSGDPADDKHGVYISDGEGVTWTEVVAPIADSGAPTNRPAFEAAFSGETEQVIFIWGPPDYMSYSDDFGATLQDKSGNLSSFSMPGFIGITGGPE